jgi:hypothetical protein
MNSIATKILRTPGPDEGFYDDSVVVVVVVVVAIL